MFFISLSRFDISQVKHDTVFALGGGRCMFSHFDPSFYKRKEIKLHLAC